MLIPVRTGAEFQGCRDSRGPHTVDLLMALPDGVEYRLPFSFDVGAISVQLDLQTGFFEDFLAGGHVWGYRYTDTQGDDAQICDHVHSQFAIPDVEF